MRTAYLEAYLRPAELIIPLGLLAFAGTGINFLDTIFNTTTRWGILAALSLFLLLARRRDILNVGQHPLLWLIVAYGTWGLMSVTWSEIPQLSIAKSAVFFWVTITMLVAGYTWVMRHDQVRTFDFLWLFVLATLFASPTNTYDEGDLSLYYGLTGNPNFLGFVLAIASVWIVWRAYLAHRQKSRLLMLYLALFVSTGYFSYLAHSRASILILFVVLLGLLVGFGRLKKLLPLILFAGMVSGAIYYYSPAVQHAVTQYVAKSDLGSEGMFVSREDVWQESYERAVRGGVLGGGLGVNLGMNFYGEIGATVSSGQYGREHGNSQFAIIEQIGLMGLGIYITLVLGILWTCISALRAARSEVERVAAGLLGGVIAGLIIHSMFEAWWVAPGSVESATFWMLVGALLGVARRSAKMAASQRRAAGVFQVQDARMPMSSAKVRL